MRYSLFLVALALLSLLSSTIAAAPPAAVKPAALKPGDTIMMVAPAGELNRVRVELAVKRLEEMGFKVIVPDDLYRVRGFLAGTDEQRADELMRAFTDPEVDAIFPGTGGYGTMRMLDLLDYDAIRANPKMLIGFSDITGLHMAMQAKVGLVTYHSPNPQWGLGSEDNLRPLSAKYFWRNLLASQNQGPTGFTYQPPADDPIVALAPGVGEGPLCGGNLTLVASLTGSEYQLDTRGRILFLEDVREAPYRVDRMLCQLKLSGQLDACAGVVLGKFHKCDIDKDEDGEEESSLSLDDVFNDYFANAPYPVVKNFPAGHVKNNATLPFGVPARLNADKFELRVLENPVKVD